MFGMMGLNNKMMGSKSSGMPEMNLGTSSPFDSMPGMTGDPFSSIPGLNNSGSVGFPMNDNYY